MTKLHAYLLAASTILISVVAGSRAGAQATYAYVGSVAVAGSDTAPTMAGQLHAIGGDGGLVLWAQGTEANREGFVAFEHTMPYGNYKSGSISVRPMSGATYPYSWIMRMNAAYVDENDHQRDDIGYTQCGNFGITIWPTAADGTDCWGAHAFVIRGDLYVTGHIYEMGTSSPVK